jgi:hypothetical protein
MRVLSYSLYIDSLSVLVGHFLSMMSCSYIKVGTEERYAFSLANVNLI